MRVEKTEIQGVFMTSPHFRKCLSAYSAEECPSKKTSSISFNSTENGLLACYRCWPILERKADRANSRKISQETLAEMIGTT